MLLCKTVCSSVRKPEALLAASSCSQLCRLFTSCEAASIWSTPVTTRPIVEAKAADASGESLQCNCTCKYAYVLHLNLSCILFTSQAVSCSHFSFYWIYSCSLQLSRNCTSRCTTDWHGNTLRYSGLRGDVNIKPNSCYKWGIKIDFKAWRCWMSC